MEAQPLVEARLISPDSWRAAGSAGTRSGLPLAARPPPPPPSGAGLCSLSRSLRATPGAASSFSERGAAAAAGNSSCRTIWLSLRRKSGFTWRLPGHVTARVPDPRRVGKVGRRRTRCRAERLSTRLRGGRSDWTRTGWKWGERSGLASGQAGRGRKHARSPAWFNGPCCGRWNSEACSQSFICFSPRLLTFLPEV